VQYIFSGDIINIISGIGAYNFDTHAFIKAFREGDPIAQEVIVDRNSTQKHYGYYLYNYIPIGNDARLTIGASYDDFQHQRRDVEEFNPKVGLEWNILQGLLFRVAAFQTVKPALVASQTIQPTQVAGFNQFYDDRNGTQSRLYGLGVDARIAEGLYTGAEISRRDLDTPPIGITEVPFVLADQREDNYRGYVYMTINENWALGMEMEADIFNSSNERREPPLEVKTLSVPISLSYFDKRGFFGSLSGRYVRQDVVRSKETTMVSRAEGEESFAVVDIGLGYRLPERRGVVGFEITNILDEKFRFQDDSFRELGRGEPRGSRYIPERTFLTRVTLNF
jgi:hypothetical protein